MDRHSTRPTRSVAGLMVGIVAAALATVSSVFLIDHSPPFQYVLRVPDQVPERILWWSGKDGRLLDIDGRYRYKHLHSNGYTFCLFFFLTDGINVVRERPDDGAPISEIAFHQGPRVPGFDAQQDGYRECWRQLRRQVLRYGEARVRQNLMQPEVLDSLFPWD